MIRFSYVFRGNKRCRQGKTAVVKLMKATCFIRGYPFSVFMFVRMYVCMYESVYIYTVLSYIVRSTAAWYIRGFSFRHMWEGGGVEGLISRRM